MFIIIFVLEDEGLGEADSFVGQSPVQSQSSSSQSSVSASGLFQGATSSASDPFAQLNQGVPPPGPPPPFRASTAPPGSTAGPGVRTGGTPPLGLGGSTVGRSSPGQQSGPPPTGLQSVPPLAAVPPMPSTSGKVIGYVYISLEFFNQQSVVYVVFINFKDIYMQLCDLLCI